MEIFTELAREYGVWVALTVILFYQQRKDYVKCSEELNRVGEFVRTTLTELITETNALMREVKEIMDKCNKPR